MKDADTFDAEVVLKPEEVSKLLAKKEITGCSVDEVVAAKAKGEIIGYIFTTTTSEGYGGNIQISVGILNDGTVTGVEMLSISETAGLGMKATAKDWLSQFIGKGSGILVNKNSSSETEIQAITSATITSQAVTDAVNSAFDVLSQVKGGAENG